MFKIYKSLAVIFVLFATIGNLQSQSDKVIIKLKQPPPNQLGVGDMWNLELTNTTDKDIKIFLTGTATEEKDGLIIEGKSKVFTLKPGRSTYKYNDFSGAEVKYNNGKYKEIILRTGNAPEGSYTICVTAFDEGGTEVGRENCIMQSVQQMGSITLLTPGDGEEVDPQMPLMFTWTPLPKGGPYTLRIVELKGSESPEVAMKQNRAIFEVNDIRTTTHHVAPSQVKVIMMGMKYAWQVTSGDVESEVAMFSLLVSQYQIVVDTVIIECDTLLPNTYNYDIRVINNNNPATGPSNIANAYVIATNPVASTIIPALNTQTSVSYPNTVSIVGSISFSSIVSSVQFVVKMEDNTSPTIYNATTPYTVSLPVCCVNPPSGMSCWWTFDEPVGTVTSDDREMFNNQGSFVGSPQVLTGMVDNALRFSGNNYVEVQNHSEINFGPCESFTIDAWVRTIPPHTNSSNSTNTILDKREGGNCASLGYALYLSWGRIGFQVGSGPNFVNYGATSGSLINDGNWHFIAVTYDRASSILTLYQDGAVVRTVSSLNIPNLNNSSSLVIGGRHPIYGFSSFNGDIDELEIFKRALTLSEIQSIFNANSSGKCKN